MPSSTAEENSETNAMDISTSACGENDRTVVDPSSANMMEEIRLLKDCLKSLSDKFQAMQSSMDHQNLHNAAPPLPNVTTLATATCPPYLPPTSNGVHVLMPNTCEYESPFYYLPNTVPHTMSVTTTAIASPNRIATLTHAQLPQVSTYTTARMTPMATASNFSALLPEAKPFNSNDFLPTTTTISSNTYSSAPQTTSSDFNFFVPRVPTLNNSSFVPQVPSSNYSAFVPQIRQSNFNAFLPQATTTNPYTSLSQPPQGNAVLRKLHDLPEFSGQPEQWPMFAVAYRETTQNYSYTKLENLQRLHRALRGDAKSKVEAFLIHPDSVDQVMRMLEFHYGRPEVLIRSQILKARAFPAIGDKRIYEIVNFSTMVSNLATFLENAGATPHLSNPTLLDELVGKLPMSKREEWMKFSRNSVGQYPTVREFSLWLHEVATYVSLAAEADSNEHSYNKNQKIKSSFAITQRDNNPIICPMCQSQHYLYQCEKFKKLAIAERWQLVKSNGLCFACLRAGHVSRKCQNKRQCNLSQCVKYHNRLLHGDSNELSSNKADSVNTITENAFNKNTLFKFLPVTLIGPKGTVRVIAFIDEGSKISLVEEDIARRIGLQGRTSNLCLGWIGGRTTNETSKNVNMEIAGINDNKSYQMRNVYTTTNLQLPPQSLDIKLLEESFPALRNIKVDDYFDVRPKLLIGLPHIRLIRPFSVVNLDECFAVHQTLLGNVFFGSNEITTEAIVCKIDADVLQNIQKDVSDYLSIESFGVKNLEPLVSADDQRAEQILTNSTTATNCQYSTGLLWQDKRFGFRNSYQMAFKRLQTVEAKMKKDENIAEWYRAKINDYVCKSYARKLTKEEASIKDRHTWYLPHFFVVNVNKGNKRRLVFDAAASVDGESFNSRLMKGPSKYQPKSLISILFRFRQKQIGVCADIKEMFHRVKIREEDQTAQRFLWRDGDDSKLPDEYVMQVMIFGSVCSPCSAQYVKNLNAEKYQSTHAEAFKAIVDCHYVDDYVDSFQHIEDAVRVCKDVVSIQKNAGFELRGFVSNVRLLEEVMNEGGVLHSDLSLTDLNKDEISEKVLGMFWLPSEDSFCFVFKFFKVPRAVLTGERKPTKAEVLSLTMSIFDPFGFLANILIVSKILLQELWRYKIDWGSPIPDEVYTKWFEWYSDLKNVQQVKIPRCYNTRFCESTDISLHVFVDASEVAFAAVAYWTIGGDNCSDVVFVAGKSKCAPLKPLSIPRLELQAAVLGVRLKEAIISNHDVKPKNVIFWSDSKTVIKWIRSDCRVYKQFVCHRIAEILDLSEVEQWRWVPGAKNPADEATRSCSFSTKNFWLKGPAFLKLNEDQWPNLPADISEHECIVERRTKFLCTISNVASDLFERYSSYYKLIRVMCWIRRAIERFKLLLTPQFKPNMTHYTFIAPSEVIKSEILLCQKAQRDSFCEEYYKLVQGKSITKESKIFKLNPFIDSDGVIRMSGRINNSDCVTRATKEPIILPKDHILTKLIIKQYHEDFRHQNQESICAAIRIKFWIPSIRQQVRSATKNCQLCKNERAVPVPPLMGQLPIDRITPFVRPFTYTGLDYMGPFLVSIGRRQEKRWVALFTCLTVRAIHLEIARDLSTDAVILCIRNFVNRRGLPVRIRSDRGTNFIGASKEEFAFEEVKVADECTRRGIEWSFNTPANPSAGGAWERMVRAVKNVMHFTLKEKFPRVETLHSILIEAENLVNSRPLTHLPVESDDSEPLTPNHFLLGCPNLVQTPAVPEKACLRKQWHILQQMKQTFWKRWVQEYLPELTRRTKWHDKVKPIQVGDVVVICADNEARGEWKRGIVREVFPAADGQVRSAVVSTSNGYLRRPASKLAVLDVSCKSP